MTGVCKQYNITLKFVNLAAETYNNSTIENLTILLYNKKKYLLHIKSYKFKYSVWMSLVN